MNPAFNGLNLSIDRAIDEDFGPKHPEKLLDYNWASK